MSDEYRIVEVRSNVDRLSASAVHRLFVDMISRTTHAGETFLKSIAPRGSTEKLARAVTSSGPHDAGDHIDAAVGIPPIADVADRMAHKPSPDFFTPSGHTAADYPLFRDRGTGMFGPAHAPIHSHTGGPMKFEGTDGNLVFARSVQGQPGGHFMLATFEEMRRVALPADAEIFREHVQHLYLEPNPK